MRIVVTEGNSNVRGKPGRITQVIDKDACVAFDDPAIATRILPITSLCPLQDQAELPGQEVIDAGEVLEQKLWKLKQMQADGILTEEEYAIQKAPVLLEL